MLIRRAGAKDAGRIHALIASCLDEGRLLPRSRDDVALHVARFVVAVRCSRIVGCAEMAPLGPRVAEIRSLVVHPSARSLGAGSQLVDEIRRLAQQDGFEQLCAFTHAPAWFSQRGFSLVPHRWLPEKIAADCLMCPGFRRCGQQAMVLPLDAAPEAAVHDRPGLAHAL